MKLRDYLKENGLTQAKFAKKAKVSQGVVSAIIRGRYNPTFDLLTRISKATKGAFKPEDFERKLRQSK